MSVAGASRWPWIWPAVALFVAFPALGVGGFAGSSWLWVPVVVALVGTVLATVHHAEVIAERVGEPYGTLVLAVAVTVIEVALIVSLMLADDTPNMALPRDTVFAAVMIIITGMVGACLFSGSMLHGEQQFQLLDGLRGRLDVGTILGDVIHIFVAAVNGVRRTWVGPDVVCTVRKALLRTEVESMLDLG